MTEGTGSEDHARGYSSHGLNFCWAIQVVVSEYGVNNVKVWIQLA